SRRALATFFSSSTTSTRIPLELYRGCGEIAPDTNVRESSVASRTDCADHRLVDRISNPRRPYEKADHERSRCVHTCVHTGDARCPCRAGGDGLGERSE